MQISFSISSLALRMFPRSTKQWWTPDLENNGELDSNTEKANELTKLERNRWQWPMDGKLSEDSRDLKGIENNGKQEKSNEVRNTTNLKKITGPTSLKVEFGSKQTN